MKAGLEKFFEQRHGNQEQLDGCCANGGVAKCLCPPTHDGDQCEIREWLFFLTSHSASLDCVIFTTTFV